MNTKKNRKNKKSKTQKLKKHINALQFYAIKVIPPRNLNKYIAKHKLLKKIKTVVLPEIKKHNINVYLVPLPSSDNNHYFQTLSMIILKSILIKITTKKMGLF